MKIKAKYASLEDIPEEYRDLYEERSGEWLLVGIEGIRTDADVQRVQRSLQQERTAHAETRQRLEAFGDVDPETLPDTLSELEELRARSKGGDDEEERIRLAVEARIKRETGPLQRQVDQLARANEQLTSQNGELQTTITQGKIKLALGDAASKAKVVGSAIEDIVDIGSRVFEVTEEGTIVTRDGVGATPGIAPEAWLEEMKEKRAHWWPASNGGGARGGEGGGTGGANPWSAQNWNLTEQGRVINTKGREHADRLAKAMGSKVGATHPPAA